MPQQIADEREAKLRAEIERLNNGYVIERAARSEAEAEVERLRGHLQHRDKEIARLEGIIVQLRATLDGIVQWSVDYKDAWDRAKNGLRTLEQKVKP